MIFFLGVLCGWSLYSALALVFDRDPDTVVRNLKAWRDLLRGNSRG